MRNTLIGNAGDGCKAAGSPAASLLVLAATPTFAVMALWSTAAGGPAEMICNGGSAFCPNGMAAMYALMSVFHVSPWLTLLSNWRNDEGKARHSRVDIKLTS